MLLSHYFFKMMGKSTPGCILIAPTYRCQCHCVHCAANSSHNDEGIILTASQIKSVIDQACQLGVIQVIFTGGEPLLREDIEELISYAHNAGLITRIITNGILLNRSLVLKLKKAGLTQCSVSIDDANSKIHDRLRGFPGSYKKAIKGIKILNEFGILCQIHTCATKRNMNGGLERIIQLAKTLKVFAVCIGFPLALGRWNHRCDQILSKEEKENARNLQDLKLVHLEFATPQTRCRISQKGFLFISPQGNITPCPFVPNSFGNINSLSLKRVWEYHCLNLKLDYRGECPMNDLEKRDAIKHHVLSTAQFLNSKEEK